MCVRARGLTKYHSGDEIKKNEMGGACSMHGGRRCAEFWWEELRERDYWETSAQMGR